MRRVTILAVAVLVACERAHSADFEPLTLRPPVTAVALIREAKDKAEGGYDLFHPTRPIPVNGAVWVLESGNDQLVRFDSALSRASAFGREGEGPGEIQFAQDMIVTGDSLLVAESGNGRVSIFDTTGAFRGTLRVAESPRFLARVPGRLLTTLDLSPAYAYAVDVRGGLTPDAEIPEIVRRLAASDSATYLPAGPYVAAGGDGDLFVLDQSVLALSQFGPDGRLLRVGLLPDPFRARLLERRLATQKGFGARAAAILDSPAAKRISVTSDGLVLILFSLPDTWGLLVDPRTWTARPLPLPENRRLHDLLWSASDASLAGDRLYVISGSQLYQFAAEGWR